MYPDMPLKTDGRTMPIVMLLTGQMQLTKVIMETLT